MPVKEYSHLILATGRYEIVALSRTDDFDPAHVIAYDVLATSGSRIRRELTLDDAKARIEMLLHEEQPSRPSASRGLVRRMRR